MYSYFNGPRNRTGTSGDEPQHDTHFTSIVYNKLVQPQVPCDYLVNDLNPSYQSKPLQKKTEHSMF